MLLMYRINVKYSKCGVSSGVFVKKTFECVLQTDKDKPFDIV